MMWFVIVPAWLFFLGCLVQLVAGIWIAIDNGGSDERALYEERAAGRSSPPLQELSDRLTAALRPR